MWPIRTVPIMLMVTGAVNPAAGDLEKCIIQTHGSRTIDLNVLASGGLSETNDYEVSSIKFPKFEYVFNVCDKLRFSDPICVPGSTMCDRVIDSETSVGIYGSLESMIVELQHYHRNGTGELVPTIEFDSVEPCTYRPSKVTVAKIYFLCDPTAYTPLLSIKYEDYLECEIEINFASVAACIGFPLKYACGDGYACRPSADGTQTREECMSKCIDPNPPAPPTMPPPPPPVRYACNSYVSPGECYESTSGIYESAESCDTHCTYRPPKFDCKDDGCTMDPFGAFKSEEECHQSCVPKPSKYICSAGQCVKNTQGNFPNATECLANCKVPEIMYACIDDKCEEDPNGVFKSVAACEEDCGGVVTTYACVDDMCVLRGSGEYKDKPDCEAACGTPPATKYKCDAEQRICVEDSNGPFPSESSCESECRKPQSYKCSVDFKCVLDPEGKYSNESTCESECHTPADKYRCVDDKCAADAEGIDKQTCEEICIPALAVAEAQASRRHGYRCIHNRVVPVLYGGSAYKTVATACGPYKAQL
eukprot:m.1043234 g.1043234  ORF g.1043234 m.1043234 type:complete len:535 (+) comp24167_c0_seq5:291-1895(+)